MNKIVLQRIALEDNFYYQMEQCGDKWGICLLLEIQIQMAVILMGIPILALCIFTILWERELIRQVSYQWDWSLFSPQWCLPFLLLFSKDFYKKLLI
ncbi:hypothetical protein PGRAT_19645 [Paenibacillus graminis]|uniref:Uncharacterized protein n=1 Tax=Paenibacillus graminis TaxID=189425 RepID=A0A089NKK0_9BACL|nr:hypothetical protein PGRAT_19645 [Paenibacillus graminis]